MVMALTERRDEPGIHEPAVGCSVGIMAYNEEANIADAIGAVLGQKLSSSEIAELIVVASGCEDRTVPIVSEIAGRDPRVRLIEQERREGKASAINLFIGAATAPVLLMGGSGGAVEDGPIGAVAAELEGPGGGMVRRHPDPVKGEIKFLRH